MVAYTNANYRITLETVGVLATGQLARVLAAFLANNPAGNLTLANVRTEIERLFMSKEEQQQIRASLANIYQKPYQDIKAYGRAFELTDQRAYAASDLVHNMIQEQLVRMLVTGLRRKGSS